MDAERLRAVQAPIKAKYRDDPSSARLTLRARGELTGEGLTCRVETRGGPIDAGLHPATGGEGGAVCSGEIPGPPHYELLTT